MKRSAVTFLKHGTFQRFTGGHWRFTVRRERKREGERESNLTINRVQFNQVDIL